MIATRSTWRDSQGKLRIYRYYRCGEGMKRNAEHRDGQHDATVRVETIKESVLRKAQELEDPDALERILADRTEKERSTLQEQKAELERARASLGAEIARLLEAHTRWQSIGAKEFDEAMAEAAQRRKELDATLLDVTMSLEELPEPHIRREQLRSLATDVELILDSPQIEEANAWLSKRIRAIWCEGREVKRVELR